ncbi:hypothetical protein ACN47E_004886 [Coniothyrium glycines]
MSCWRVLHLTEPDEQARLPQLLVKPDFGADSYTVHLTDLTNIWREELDLHAIVARAAEEQSPIEVAKQDAAQLAHLLEHVKKALGSSDDATCRVTRSTIGDLTLHAVIALPEPLDSLAWTFHFSKQSTVTLRNELILPLLVSSHIQHERIASLVAVIAEKDRAITRLVDQFESSNLDLAAAFPSVSSLKLGRKTVKREQAAKHVPALQPFREHTWRQATEQLENLDLTTLGLFQEALAQNTPTVPRQLLVSDDRSPWWTTLPDRLDRSIFPAPKTAKTSVQKVRHEPTIDTDEEETEDEFETHNHSNTRKPHSNGKHLPSAAASQSRQVTENNVAESSEEEDDLNAPAKSQRLPQEQGTSIRPLPSNLSQSEAVPVPDDVSSHVTKAKGSIFKIGGKSTKLSINTSPPDDHPVSNGERPPIRESSRSSPILDCPVESTPRMNRRPFRIGGKDKHAVEGGGKRLMPSSPVEATRARAAQSPAAGPPSSPPSIRENRDSTPMEQINEETPEEKAERKRAELKRKTEEAAKKQAQHKKKKRF